MCESKQAKWRECLGRKWVVKVKGMPERKLCYQGTWSHFNDLKNLATKKHNTQQCGDEEIKSDKHVKAMQG